MVKKIDATKSPLMLFILAILVGILVMCIPIISSNFNHRKSLEYIENYSKDVSINSDKINNAILEQAENYNKLVAGTDILASFSDDREESEEYLGQLNVNDDGVMGYIKIPRIDVEIPIYHGTSSKTLQKGVGHLEGSSLPIGGKGTHAILSGHRGLPSSKLFTDLDQLKENDMFYIYVLDKVLAYKVNQVKVIEPDDTSDLAIVNDKDCITLVTCTPYALNTHRLLVRGERVEYNKKVLEEIEPSKKITISDVIFFGGLLLAGIIVVIAVRKIIILNKQSSNKDIEELSLDEEPSKLKKFEFLDDNTKEIEVLDGNVKSNEDIEVLNSDDFI